MAAPSYSISNFPPFFRAVGKQVHTVIQSSDYCLFRCFKMNSNNDINVNEHCEDSPVSQDLSLEQEINPGKV